MSEDHEIIRLPNLVLDELSRRVEASGSKKAVAEQLEISQQHLGDIMSGKRTVGPNLLEKLGFVKISFHARRENALRVVRILEVALNEEKHMQRLMDKVLEKV
jgi:Helix-turn-helix.